MTTTTQPARLNAHEIATALLGGECYMVLESDNPPQSSINPSSLGMAGRNYDVILKPWLAQRGLWCGRRPAIYVADKLIWQHVVEWANGDESLAVGLYNQVLAAVVAHEAGHVAEQGICLKEQTAEWQHFTRAMAAYSIAAKDSGDSPPFFSHSATWVRLSIHAAYRAKQFGWEFPLHFLFSGELYGIAEPEEFAYALDMEPSNMAKISLPEIPTFTAPTRFRRLWNQCVNYWIDQQPSDAPGIKSAVELLEDNRGFYECIA